MSKIMEMLTALLVAVGMGTSVVATSTPPAPSSHAPEKSIVLSAPPGTAIKLPAARETKQASEGEDNRVAQAIAQEYGISVAAVTALHDQGFGYGEIAKVYALAKASGKSVTEIVNLKTSGQGWGEIEKELGIQPGTVDPNLGEIMRDASPKNSNDKPNPKETPPGNSGDHRPDKDKGKPNK